MPGLRTSAAHDHRHAHHGQRRLTDAIELSNAGRSDDRGDR
jgi:hypothetical protein